MNFHPKSVAVRGAIAALLFSVLFLEACTSMSKQAASSLEAGDYEKAAALYERVVERDPGDKEAIAGLKKARAGVIEQRLILVRKARQTKQDERALEELLELLEIERKWKMGPPAQSAFTQEEEMGFAVSTAASKLENGLKDGKPLAMETVLARYAPIFQGKNEAKLKGFERRVKDSGRDHCKELRKPDLRSKPYFAEFVVRYCGHWGVDTSDLAGKVGSKSADLYRDAELDAKIENLPARLVPQAREAFLAALKKTAWYDPHGKQTLKVSLAGRYEYDLQKVQVSLVHEYQEPEQYVEMEDVTKTRQVEYTAFEPVMDPVTKVVVQKPVTKYRAESYVERQPVTRTRMVTKTFPYGAWKHIQRMKLEASGDVAVADRKLATQIHDESQGSDDQHDLNMPKIGLKPKKPNLPEQDAWIKGHLARMGAETEKKLADLWTEMYCEPSTEVGGVEVNGEQVMRCARQAQGRMPAFVEEWYQRNFGLGAAAVADRLKR